MKEQIKRTVTFINEARQIVAGEQARATSQFEQARTIATARQADILAMGDKPARDAIRADVKQAFSDAGYPESTAKHAATVWAAVIHALATGATMPEHAANIQAVYRWMTENKPKDGKQGGRPAAAKTADSFKGDQAHAAEHMAKLNAPQRGEYAHRTLSAVAESLKDGTVSNTMLAAALEFAMQYPEAVLELAKAQGVLKTASRRKAA